MTTASGLKSTSGRKVHQGNIKTVIVKYLLKILKVFPVCITLQVLSKSTITSSKMSVIQQIKLTKIMFYLHYILTNIFQAFFTLIVIIVLC